MYSPQVVHLMLQGAITRMIKVEFRPPPLLGTWLEYRAHDIWSKAEEIKIEGQLLNSIPLPDQNLGGNICSTLSSLPSCLLSLNALKCKCYTANK